MQIVALEEFDWDIKRNQLHVYSEVFGGGFPREFGVRSHHTGRVVSRTELVEHLYDQDFDRDSNTIEVFVGRIRKKLGIDIIQTVRGLGYLLTPPDAR